MERYTYKKDHYGDVDILCKCVYPRYEAGNDKPVAYYGQAIDKLAAYEDTGLTPEQLKEIYRQCNRRLIDATAIETQLRYAEFPKDEKVTWLEAYKHFMEIIENAPDPVTLIHGEGE